VLAHTEGLSTTSLVSRGGVGTENLSMHSRGEPKPLTRRNTLCAGPEPQAGLRSVQNRGSSHTTSEFATDGEHHLAAMQESIASQVFPAALGCAVFGASRLTRVRSQPPFRRSPTLRVVVHAPRSAMSVRR